MAGGLSRALRFECLRDSQAVLVDVVPGDKAALDGEMQSEPSLVGTSGGTGGLPNLAQHDCVASVDQDALDLSRYLLRHVVLGQLRIVGGRVGPGRPVTDPRRGSTAVLGLRPVELWTQEPVT